MSRYFTIERLGNEPLPKWDSPDRRLPVWAAEEETAPAKKYAGARNVKIPACAMEVAQVMANGQPLPERAAAAVHGEYRRASGATLGRLLAALIVAMAEYKPRD